MPAFYQRKARLHIGVDEQRVAKADIKKKGGKKNFVGGTSKNLH
jgi:hypothetical protein